MVPLDRESIWKRGQQPQSTNNVFYMKSVTYYLHWKTCFRKIYALVIKIDLVFELILWTSKEGHVTYSQSQYCIQQCTNCMGTTGPLKTMYNECNMYFLLPKIIFLLIGMTHNSRKCGNIGSKQKLNI